MTDEIPSRVLRPGPILAALVARDVDFVLIGGLAAATYGSPFPTFDVDVVPAGDPTNLARLSDALRDLDARVRRPGEPDGLPFAHDAVSLAAVVFWNLTTPHGDLDITFVPSGTTGFDELIAGSTREEIFSVVVPVASLADIIRSKQAANRPKDQRVLPTLRELLLRIEQSR